MKVVMINDCSFVGETLLKYMPHSVEKQHIKHTRHFLSKTFGLACKTMGAKGDVYHAHYLMQDCYIAARLGKIPLIGHAHGGDLRQNLRHPLWARIVRYNLKKSDKILVSTPDILWIAKLFKEDAEYLPNPVDTEYFYPKVKNSHEGKKKVLIASDCNWHLKGTDIALKALNKIKDEVSVSIIGYGVDLGKTIALASFLGIRLNILSKVVHEKLAQYYWDADVVIDRFKLGSLGVVSLEAIACGRPVVTYVSSEFPEYNDFPLKDIITEEAIIKSVRDADNWLWKKEYNYLTAAHQIKTLTERLLKLYEALKR